MTEDGIGAVISNCPYLYVLRLSEENEAPESNLHDIETHTKKVQDGWVEFPFCEVTVLTAQTRAGYKVQT